MTTSATDALIRQIAASLIDRRWRVATAESCTGGGIATALTDLAGSSAWFDCGLVTYSNEAKQQLLGVSEASLLEAGAVSETVVKQMVAGALKQSQAQVAVAVSGIAGPDGGTEDKPVGTVWIAWGIEGQAPKAECFLFPGDRAEVRTQTIVAALSGMQQLLTADADMP